MATAMRWLEVATVDDLVAASRTDPAPETALPPSSMDERIQQGRGAMLICAVGFLTYLALVLLIHGAGWVRFAIVPAAAILCVTVCFDLGLAATAARWAPRDASVYLIEAVHAVVDGAVMYTLGGTRMGIFFVAYAFAIFHAEMVRSDASLFVAANICGACYTAFALAELYGWLTPLPLPDVPPVRDPHVYLASIVTAFVALNLLVFFSRGYGHQLRYLAARLRQLVALRTAELTRANAELAAKAAALEQKQDEVRAFVYTVTHDLKNPVNAMLLTVDLVLAREADRLSARSRDDLSAVLRLAEGAERMILDLLGMFKIVSAREAPMRVEPSALVARAREQLAPQIAAKGVRLTVGPLPAVWGQPEKLAHVVTNLLSNAVKYVPAGRGRVEVTGRRVDAQVELVVRDDGIGIPPQYHHSVFRLFGRVPDGEQRVDGERVAGSGVGLTIVTRIVESHGGTIGLESRPGAGSCFRIRLPAAPPAEGS